MSNEFTLVVSGIPIGRFAYIGNDSLSNPNIVGQSLLAIWKEFQATHPDSDSQFFPFIRERGYPWWNLGLGNVVSI